MNNLTELLKVQLDINKTNADLIDSLKEQINTLFGLNNKMLDEIEDNYAEILTLQKRIDKLNKRLELLESNFWENINGNDW